MKKVRMYNLTLLRREDGKIYHDATLEWNKPFLIVRSILRQQRDNPRFNIAKGQFLYPVPNSRDPLDYYRERQTKAKATSNTKVK